MKKLLSLFAAVLFAGLLFAAPYKYKSDCVDGWSWIGDKRINESVLDYSVYSNPNACLLFLAVDKYGNCYDVKRDNEGYYYLLYRGEWRKMY